MRFISLLPVTLFLLVSFAEASAPFEEANIHYQKALKLSQQRLWKDAIPEFIKATKLAPKEGLLHANLGVALSQTGMHKEALYSSTKHCNWDMTHPGFVTTVEFLLHI